MSCFDYRWLLRVSARAGEFRTGVLFCLLLKHHLQLQLSLKTTSWVYSVGLLHKFWVNLLCFASPVYASGGCHDRSCCLWNLGNIEFPKQFFLNTQYWLISSPTVQKWPCANKAARRHICFGLSGFKSRAAIVRVLMGDAWWRSTPRARKLVPATLSLYP